VRDVEALADRISRLLENKQLRDRLGKTGLSMVKQHYTIRDVTKNTLDVYSKVLS
jgi:glycosyltransferase involved in cell wall biosynthesis